MSVDTQKIAELLPFIYIVWNAPIQITVAIVMLYNTLGVSVFSGLGVLLLLIPFNSILSYYARTYQTIQMKLKDERINLMNEVLSGIKVLKLYAWEPSYEQKIADIRKQEVKCLRTTALLNTKTAFTFQCAPFLVSFKFQRCIIIGRFKYTDAILNFTYF